jgi:Family of unknown function (DUF5681)
MSNLETLKPFQSGDDPRRNLNGRPKGSKNKHSELMKMLQKKVGDGKDKTTVMDLLIETIIKKALKGDHAMIKLIWEHCDGKPRTQSGKQYLD